MKNKKTWWFENTTNWTCSKNAQVQQLQQVQTPLKTQPKHNIPKHNIPKYNASSVIMHKHTYNFKDNDNDIIHTDILLSYISETYVNIRNNIIKKYNIVFKNMKTNLIKSKTNIIKKYNNILKYFKKYYNIITREINKPEKTQFIWVVYMWLSPVLFNWIIKLYSYIIWDNILVYLVSLSLSIMLFIYWFKKFLLLK